MDAGAWWAAVHGVAKGRKRLSDFIFTFHFPLSSIGGESGNPLQCSCLENFRDGGAWWAAVSGVAQSRTRRKPHSSRCSNGILGVTVGSVGEESACSAEDAGSILGWGRSLEEGLATHSSILAWRIPWTRGAWAVTVHSVAESITTETTACTTEYHGLLDNKHLFLGVLKATNLVRPSS